MICTRPNTTSSEAPSWLGEPCPDCGHTSLAHPGITNLTLDACLVCEVQAAVQQLRADDTEDHQAVLAHTQALADQATLMAELRARIEQLETPGLMQEGGA